MARYTLENLHTLLRRPSRLKGAFSHLGTRLNQAYHRMRPTKGTFVMEEDWDNLIILDGCRYDIFPEDFVMDGDLSMRRSRGSNSVEFINENFVGETLHDTVYITANPHMYLLSENTFHHVENLIEDGWDPEYQTVLPGTVVRRARKLIEVHPNKRMIIHFMQPHYPFIGTLGQSFDQSGFSQLESEDDDDSELAGRHIWLKLQYRLGVDEDEVWAAYRENLDVALSYVAKLMDDLEGKTVITSDHGNLVGDKLSPIPVAGYGHPRNLPVDPLINVPWYTIESGCRRQIISETPNTSQAPEQDELQGKLKFLGYR